MRPVDKPHPIDSRTGKPKQYSQYGDAKPDLLDLLGEFCSYCEMELKDGTEVEHVQPKSLNPTLLKEWSNFLLACKRCNTRKRDKPVDLDDHLWPDLDNTLAAFEYLPTNRVVVSNTLDPVNRQRAQRLLELVELDHIPNKHGSDPRFDHRRKVWAKATDALNDLWEAKPDARPALRKWIVENAKVAGHFSVWMTVFVDDAEIRGRLIEEFAGTSKDCFHSESKKLVPRLGGKL